MGLCAFDEPHRSSIRRGIEYLVRSQNADGSWTEHETTGTGFPKVFYLKYDMYRNSWPLLALATYRKLLAQADGVADTDADEEFDCSSEAVGAMGKAPARSESLS